MRRGRCACVFQPQVHDLGRRVGRDEDAQLLVQLMALVRIGRVAGAMAYQVGRGRRRRQWRRRPDLGCLLVA